jgi:hypothetical protein
MAQSHSVLDCFEGLLRRLHKALDVYVFQLSEADDKRPGHPFACNMRNLTCNLRRLTCDMRHATMGGRGRSHPLLTDLQSTATVRTRCHICSGTGLAPAPSAPALGSPLPDLHQVFARRCQICARRPGSPVPHLRRDLRSAATKRLVVSQLRAGCPSPGFRRHCNDRSTLSTPTRCGRRTGWSSRASSASASLLPSGSDRGKRIAQCRATHNAKGSPRTTRRRPISRGLFDGQQKGTQGVLKQPEPGLAVRAKPTVSHHRKRPGLARQYCAGEGKRALAQATPPAKMIDGELGGNGGNLEGLTGLDRYSDRCSAFWDTIHYGPAGPAGLAVSDGCAVDTSAV